MRSTHNICFCGEIWKIWFSGYFYYVELWLYEEFLFEAEFLSTYQLLLFYHFFFFFFFTKKTLNSSDNFEKYIWIWDLVSLLLSKLYYYIYHLSVLKIATDDILK